MNRRMLKSGMIALFALSIALVAPKTVSAEAYRLSLSQYGGAVHGALITPANDTRSFSLDFVDSQGKSRLQKSIPENATKTVGDVNTAYSFDLGNLSSTLAPGAYTVGLSSSEQNPTNFVSGSSNPITTTPLSLTKVFFEKKTDYSWELTYDKTSFSGKLTDPATVSSIAHLYLQLASSPADLDASPIVVDATKSSSLISGERGVNTDGTYHFGIPSTLSPNTTYYFRQVIESTAGGKSTSPTEQFNPRSGYTPGGAAPLPKEGVYKLLAPLPGLTAVLDPDVCAQLQAPGGPGLGDGQICDINVFLNYLFKVLIGLGAVFLVFRVVFEGYNYIVTDTPFKKSKAKSGFVGALLGLLLALSAYVILNTINPKLVENNIDIQKLQIGIDRTKITSSAFQKITGKSILAPEKYLSMAKDVARAQNIDECLLITTVTYESAWDPTNVSCDENVTRFPTLSRQAFVASGRKLDGSPADGGSKNPCTWQDSAPGYSLDWRFTKGFGLTQQTTFPAGYANKQNYLALTSPTGSLYVNRSNPSQINLEKIEYNPGQVPDSVKTVQDFINYNLDPQTNLTMGAIELRGAIRSCGADNIARIFNKYQTGSCDGSGEGQARAQTYADCKAGKIKLTP